MVESKIARSAPAGFLSNCVSTIDLSRYKQSRNYTCGPAALRMALKLLGFESEEVWLANQMSAAKGIGTKPSGFRKVLRKLRLRYSEIHNATIDDIRRFISKGFPVVVAWTFEGDGHYSLVIGATCEGLSIIEPYSGKLIEINHHRFTKLWQDPCNHTTRWMMAIISRRRRDV